MSEPDRTDSPAVEPPITKPERKLTRWQRYATGVPVPHGKQYDFQIAKKAFADGLSKKQVISLLAKHSPKARKLYHDEGSTHAYHYVEMVARAAQKAQRRTNLLQRNEGMEC